MSSQDNDIYPVTLQETFISSNLSSTLLFLFLGGAYIGFYLITFQIYCGARRSQRGRRVVTSVLAGLFGCTLGILIVQWVYTATCFAGAEANMRYDTFYLTVSDQATPAVDITTKILSGLGQVLADGLLIWRSWHLFRDRKNITLAFLGIYIVEIVMTITAIIMDFLIYLDPLRYQIDQFVQQYNIVYATSQCVTAATSMIVSLAIGMKIYSSTTMDPKARRKYMHIVEITIGSSALYSCSTLTTAITQFVNSSPTLSAYTASVSNAEAYINAITYITTAFAPTLMVVRLELAKKNPTEESSTTMNSLPNDDILGSFAAAPQDHNSSDIQEVPLDVKNIRNPTEEV